MDLISPPPPPNKDTSREHQQTSQQQYPTVISVDPTNTANGMKYMSALTMSVLRAMKDRHHRKPDQDDFGKDFSLEEMERKTAIVTSQLARISQRNIWCHYGVTTFLVAKARNIEGTDS